MHLFVCGYPGELGGANTELWHTREAVAAVRPRRHPDPHLEGRSGLARPARSDRLPDLSRAIPTILRNVPGLAGGVVVSMCNTRFLAAADRFRELGCRIVWLGCMNWLFPAERLHYRRRGAFDRHVFQSRYQHDQLRAAACRIRL